MVSVVKMAGEWPGRAVLPRGVGRHVVGTASSWTCPAEEAGNQTCIWRGCGEPWPRPRPLQTSLRGAPRRTSESRLFYFCCFPVILLPIGAVIILFPFTARSDTVHSLRPSF